MTRKTERFQVGRVAVEVTRATPDLDNLMRGYYRCDIYTTGTHRLLFRVWLRASTREDAAVLAVNQYIAR